MIDMHVICHAVCGNVQEYGKQLFYSDNLIESPSQLLWFQEHRL